MSNLQSANNEESLPVNSSDAPDYDRELQEILEFIYEKFHVIKSKKRKFATLKKCYLACKEWLFQEWIEKDKKDFFIESPFMSTAFHEKLERAGFGNLAYHAILSLSCDSLMHRIETQYFIFAIHSRMKAALKEKGFRATMRVLNWE